MRAAAILGLGSSARNLRPFQKNSAIAWTLGLPASQRDADAVLVFGGDGTIHRHLAALVELKLPVLVVPCGSGNDFARALKLRRAKDSLAAWQAFAAGGGNVRAIDIGVIHPLELQIPRLARHGKQREDVTSTDVMGFDDPASAPHATRDLKLETRNPTYFCCAGGAGLDAHIARRANRLPRWLRAHGGYVFSLVPALAKYQAVMTRISLPQPDGSWELKSAVPTFVAVFANTPDYGGGMKIAPRARLEDGVLDVCTVAEIDKLKLFCLFPTVYFGRHLSVPEVDYFQAERMRIETDTPLDVYADGEFVCRTPIEVSVAPRVLQVIVT
jgi:diacylglycerol kinase (ATP)